MELIPSNEFLEDARRLEIGPDTRYSEPRCLVYIPYRDLWRFWEVPKHSTAIPFFILRLLSGLARWEECYLWPRGGHWRSVAEESGPKQWVQSVILGGAGIPAKWEGAVRFEECEMDKIIAALFAQVVFGWCVLDDVFVIPDHGRYCLYVDHHDVIHVQFKFETDIDPFIQRMAKGNFALPSEIPDPTFKKPDWIP